MRLMSLAGIRMMYWCKSKPRCGQETQQFKDGWSMSQATPSPARPSLPHPATIPGLRQKRRQTVRGSTFCRTFLHVPYWCQ
ncbi:hypothetical protein D3C78_1680200 [compost metagenome]